MKWPLIYLIITIITFYGCSSKSTLNDSDFALTNRSVKSTISDLRVYIPQGWFFSKADMENFIDIWLIRDDYSASITFLPVYFEDKGITREDNSLGRIFGFVKVKTESGGNLITNPKETLTIDNNPMLAFEFTNTEKELSRTIVFSYKGAFYQCTAIILNSAVSPSEIFSVQNSVMKSVFRD